jgi:hypothetical protein
MEAASISDILNFRKRKVPTRLLQPPNRLQFQSWVVRTPRAWDGCEARPFSHCGRRGARHPTRISSRKSAAVATGRLQTEPRQR